MIKFENTEVVGWEHAIRGMRNQMNSWVFSDSGKIYWNGTWYTLDPVIRSYFTDYGMNLLIGPNDQKLMMTLRKAGIDHRKFMRMITVYVDITAPLYWWKEFDTYKVGTVANSCSTMHKIHAREFTIEDFSCEYLIRDYKQDCLIDEDEYDGPRNSLDILNGIINMLNKARDLYLETKDKKYWWQMIQLLPSSYNQKRTVMMNYEVLANIYKSRKNHKLDEWRAHDLVFAETENGPESYTEEGFGFCDWIKTLPYPELITGRLFKDIPICHEIIEEVKNV